MNFILLITFAALNFLLAAACLIRSGRHTAHPFAVYIVAALLFWWPVMIYPVIFASERHAADDDRRRAVCRYRLRLAWLTAGCSLVMQGIAAAVTGSLDLPMTTGDAAQTCASAATLLMSAIMLAAIGMRRTG